MDPDVVIGGVVVVTALALLVGLALWSRRIIERIADKKLGAMRDIMRDMNGGR